MMGHDAWVALKSEWERTTKLPLLSTPAKTGQALLWEHLPFNEYLPALPDEVASLIRANSFPNRIEVVGEGINRMLSGESVLDPKFCDVQYDGRWMFAALARKDRLPIGEPEKVERFDMERDKYIPGWYRVVAGVPPGWNHIGLLPMADEEGGQWRFPSRPDEVFETWISEPELSLALERKWKIKVIEGYRFTKGRPLGTWAKMLIEMRERLNETVNSYGATPDTRSAFRFAAAAIRNVLNHTVGSFHVNGYERERVIPESEWQAFKREHVDRAGYAPNFEHVEGGRQVKVMVPDNSPLSFYMPHWSSQIWALERAEVARWALMCDPRTLVKIHGDAIYSTVAQPALDELDKGRLGQPRRK